MELQMNHLNGGRLKKNKQKTTSYNFKVSEALFLINLEQERLEPKNLKSKDL